MQSEPISKEQSIGYTLYEDHHSSVQIKSRSTCFSQPLLRLIRGDRRGMENLTDGKLSL